MNKLRRPQLDARLQAVASLFDVCELGADIGADHGRLSCALLSSGVCSRMIVADISADSLQKARALLTLHQISERADFRVADGLRALMPEEKPSCIAICGMGGRQIARILWDGKNRIGECALILCAQTEQPLLRKTISLIGYHLTAERLIQAKRRYYVVMRAVPGQVQYNDRELYLGPILLRERPPLFAAYLRWREKVVACEIDHQTQLQWIREELSREAGDRTDRL